MGRVDFIGTVDWRSMTGAEKGERNHQRLGERTPTENLREGHPDRKTNFKIMEKSVFENILPQAGREGNFESRGVDSTSRPCDSGEGQSAAPIPANAGTHVGEALGQPENSPPSTNLGTLVDSSATPTEALASLEPISMDFEDMPGSDVERLLMSSGESHSEQVADSLKKLKLRKKKKQVSGAQRAKRKKAREQAANTADATNTTCQSANATGKEAQAGSEKSDLASTSGTVAKPGQAVGGDTPKATRLSGAQARKRQRAKLIARNINSELQQQGRSTPVKRSRAELTPETPEKDQAAKRYRQQAAGPSYSGATSAVKMAITHPDHPEVEITEEQSLLIQASIMDLIGDNLGQGLIKPAFSGIRLEEGAVMLYCSDGYTAGWINSITGDLTPWDGARLKAVSAQELSRGVKAIFTAPDILKKKTSEDILRKVDGQNEGLSTSKWKVISAEELEKGKRMVVRIDRDSWSTIEARGRHINLAFGRVPITSLERKSKP